MALFIVAALRTVRAVEVKRVETLVSSFNDCLEGRPSRELRLARDRQGFQLAWRLAQCSMPIVPAAAVTTATSPTAEPVAAGTKSPTS